jgi:hypothetical protein
VLIIRLVLLEESEAAFAEWWSGAVSLCVRGAHRNDRMTIAKSTVC